MSAREDLLALAERVEGATGPDRTLDAEIACAVGWGAGESYSARHLHMVGNSYADIGKHFAAIPAFTSSLDAAMTLAEGFGGQVTFYKDGGAKAFVWQPYPLAIEVKAATTALALTGATLRAHASRDSGSRPTGENPERSGGVEGEARQSGGSEASASPKFPSNINPKDHNHG